MRCACAVVLCLLTALALSGCMGRSGPVAAVQPQNDLDALAYGQQGYGQRSYAPSQVGYFHHPGAYAGPAPEPYEREYLLDAGDKLRVVVYGQEGLTNSYAIDAGGSITMPLVGAVPARGLTPAGLASHISGRLRNGYIREPSVAVEIESYRPFFILGEVAAPGPYPYVPKMKVEGPAPLPGAFSP